MYKDRCKFTGYAIPNLVSLDVDQEMPLKPKPSDLDENPEAREEYQKISAAYSSVTKQKDELTKMKNNARGQIKQELEKKAIALGQVVQP